MEKCTKANSHKPADYTLNAPAHDIIFKKYDKGFDSKDLSYHLLCSNCYQKNINNTLAWFLTPTLTYRTLTPTPYPYPLLLPLPSYRYYCTGTVCMYVLAYSTSS